MPYFRKIILACMREPEFSSLSEFKLGCLASPSRTWLFPLTFSFDKIFN